MRATSPLSQLPRHPHRPRPALLRPTTRIHSRRRRRCRQSERNRTGDQRHVGARAGVHDWRERRLRPAPLADAGPPRPPLLLRPGSPGRSEQLLRIVVLHVPGRPAAAAARLVDPLDGRAAPDAAPPSDSYRIWRQTSSGGSGRPARRGWAGRFPRPGRARRRDHGCPDRRADHRLRGTTRGSVRSCQASRCRRVATVW